MMKNRYNATPAVLLALVVTVPAYADEGESSQGSALDDRAMRKQLHEQRQAYISKKRSEKLARVHPETRRFECRIESLLDGTVMISKPYDPEVEPVLLRFGHRRVNQPPDHVGRQLYDGRVYQLLTLRDGVPEWKVKKYLGQEVEVELETFAHSGQSRIVRIRELRERRRPR